MLRSLEFFTACVHTASRDASTEFTTSKTLKLPSEELPQVSNALSVNEKQIQFKHPNVFLNTETDYTSMYSKTSRDLCLLRTFWENT